jgi:predicted DCC family thiol-disulfide oxidoreductase YuxK
MSSTSRPVVLYDADCRFCRWAARTLVRLDRRERLAFLPFDDPQAGALLAPLTANRMESWWLAQEDGRLLGGAAAGVSLLAHLGARRSAVLAERREHLLERLYETIAARRGRLGRLVPDGAAPRRYP